MELSTISSDRYLPKLLAALLKKYQSGDFSDAILVTGFGVNETRITVHRVILSASSEFFHTFFTTNLNDSDQTEFRMGEIDGGTLRLLVDYCYTGRIALSMDNVESVLRWAHQYLLIDVVALCAEYLKENLCSANCFKLRNLAKLLNINELNETVERYFAENFTKIAQTTEFKEIPLDTLFEFLKRNDLNVDAEQEVFSAVLNWLSHDRAERKKHFDVLLFDYVRVMQIDDKFIQDVIEPLAIETECIDRLRNLLRNKVKRKPMDVERMIAIGGGSNVIEYFCPITNKWKSWKTLPYPETKFDAVLHDGHLYAFYADTRKFAQIDLMTMKIMREGIFRLYANCDYHLIVHQDMICVFCSQSERYLRVVRFRRLDLKLIDTKSLDVKIWDLNITVSDNSFCVMGTVGKVEYEYVEVDVDDEEDDDNESDEVHPSRLQRGVGRTQQQQQPTRGRTQSRNVDDQRASQRDNPLQIQEAPSQAAPNAPPVTAPVPAPAPVNDDDTYVNTFVYDPVRNELVPLRCFKDEHVSTMAKCNDYIYAVCCSNEDIWWECEVKRFNPKTNKLKKVLQFDEKRVGVALFAYQGNLYAAGGGYNPNSESARMQKYDPIANVWTHTPSLLHARRKAKLLSHCFPKKLV